MISHHYKDLDNLFVFVDGVLVNTIKPSIKNNSFISGVNNHISAIFLYSQKARDFNHLIILSRIPFVNW